MAVGLLFYAKRLLDFGHVILISSHAMYFRTLQGLRLLALLCQYTKNFVPLIRGSEVKLYRSGRILFFKIFREINFQFCNFELINIFRRPQFGLLKIQCFYVPTYLYFVGALLQEFFLNCKISKEEKRKKSNNIPFLKAITLPLLLTVGQKIKKKSRPKNSWNQINQFLKLVFFDQIPFFAISKMTKNQFLNWEKV